MRPHVVFLATVVLIPAGAASGCAGAGSADTPSAAPSASVAAAPPAAVPQGTVTNAETVFLMRLASVRTARSVNLGGHRPESAGAGEELIVVRLSVKNTGKRSSRLDPSNFDPLTLVDTTGRSYRADASGATAITVDPGRVRIEPYAFKVRKGTKAASVTVALTDGEGTPSTVSLSV